jgi:hypothetical protein
VGDPALIFGDRKSFGIEIGDVHNSPNGVFVQIRFWVQAMPIGEWNDLVALEPCVYHASVILQNARFRIDAVFGELTTSEIVVKVYDAFFNYDYSVPNSIRAPNLRDCFHLDEICGSAVMDRYGVVVVSPSALESRVIVKDLKQHSIIAEATIPTDRFEASITEFVTWGEKREGQP